MIDRVDVLRPSPLLGARGMRGGINIITRAGMGKPPAQLSVNSAAFKVNLFDAPRIFYSPKHDTPKDQAFLPDTPTTIFWEPNIDIEKDGKAVVAYLNADITTTINITVEGITEEGIPVTGKTWYFVK